MKVLAHVGQMVHFHCCNAGGIFAALVTKVHDENVLDLTIFLPADDGGASSQFMLIEHERGIARRSLVLRYDPLQEIAAAPRRSGWDLLN